MAKKEHLFNLYKGFVQYEGQFHKEEDYLKKFLKHAHESNDFKSATLNPEWQMVCKKSTPQMKDYYAAGNMPYFVILEIAVAAVMHPQRECNWDFRTKLQRSG